MGMEQILSAMFTSFYVVSTSVKAGNNGREKFDEGISSTLFVKLKLSSYHFSSYVEV